MKILRTNNSQEVPVLIVGGSIVGLSAAVFLGWHGISALLIERHPDTSVHPRAGNLNARSMELLRQVGLEEAIFRQETPVEEDAERGLRVESLTGRILDSSEAEVYRQAHLSNPFASPTRTVIAGQDKVEPVLRAKAKELGDDMRFGTELLDMVQETGGVRAQIRERASGEQKSIFARYVIAADGHRSSIRQRLNIGTYGYGRLGQWVSILFRADLSQVLHKRKIRLCFINNSTLDGIIGQQEDHWALFANIKARVGEVPAGPTLEQCQQLVQAAIGNADYPFEIISTLPWELASGIAERYQEGRTFLVGDAAHVMTTMGAFGANTGIADAHNLAWKLAQVLHGRADPQLLRSYEQERQPAAELAVGVSTGLYAYRLPHIEQREKIIQSAEGLLGRVRKSQIDLQPTGFSVSNGYRYRSSAILSEDQENEALFENEPSGRPGTRAPHLWLRQNDRQISILDLYGKHFVLLTGDQGEVWQQRGHHLASNAGQPLDIHRIGERQIYTDTKNAFLAAYGITSTGAVLVRPDGYIAWRAEQSTNWSDSLQSRIIELLQGQNT